MRVSSAWIYGVVALLASVAHALVEDERPPDVGEETRALYKLEAMEFESSQRFESTAIAKVTPGVCYSPFHNAEYPLNGGAFAGLDVAMKNDFNIMKNYFSVVRTYYSSYMGLSVAKPASETGVKLFLGVYMTTEWWWASQYTDAVTAVRDYPSTVSAILVGNENVVPVGPYTAAQISAKITDMRNMVVASTGHTVPVGTVQRATDWLDPSRRSEMLALAANCDIIGVNIYPFFDSNYDASSPLVILNAIWDRMVAIYGESKLRLTEIGYPTGGAPTSYAPANIPSLANSQRFYNAYVNWNPSTGGREAFWFMFFDRKPTDTTMQADLERYFGFFTHDKRPKAADYPVLLSALTAAGAPPAVTIAAVVAPPPAPTLAAPAPTTRTPVPPPPPPATTTRPPTTAPPPTTARPPTLVTPAPPPPTTTRPPTTTTSVAPIFITLPSAVLPTNVCRVRKIFS